MGSWQDTSQSRVFCLGREANPKKVKLQAEVPLRGVFVCLSNWRGQQLWMEFVRLSGSWKETIGGSWCLAWTQDWCQSELHLVLSSSLMLCPSAGLRALGREEQSLEWHVPL